MTGAIIGVAVSSVLTLLLWAGQKGRPTTNPTDGSLLFRHTIAYRVLSWFFLFGLPVAITVLVIVTPKKDGDAWTILGIYALFLGISAPLWWEATRFSVVASEDGLECRSPWRGSQFFAWQEIDEISYSLLSKWFIIKATGLRTFRVPFFVSGIKQFLGECERHLPPSALLKAKSGYLQVGRRFPGQ